jgi:hypothetical protein
LVENDAYNLYTYIEMLESVYQWCNGVSYSTGVDKEDYGEIQ